MESIFSLPLLLLPKCQRQWMAKINNKYKNALSFEICACAIQQQQHHQTKKQSIEWIHKLRNIATDRHTDTYWPDFNGMHKSKPLHSQISVSFFRHYATQSLLIYINVWVRKEKCSAQRIIIHMTNVKRMRICKIKKKKW